MFSLPKKKPGWKEFRAQLLATPVINEGIEEIESSDTHVVLKVQLVYHGMLKIVSSLMKLKKEKKYSLDGLGFEVFRMLDGKSTVENIIDVLIVKYKLTFFEARNLLVHYLKMLMKRGLIVLAIKKEAG